MCDWVSGCVLIVYVKAVCQHAVVLACLRCTLVCVCMCVHTCSAVFARDATGLWVPGTIVSKVQEEESTGSATFFLVHPQSLDIEDFWVDR